MIAVYKVEPTKQKNTGEIVSAKLMLTNDYDLEFKEWLQNIDRTLFEPSSADHELSDTRFYNEDGTLRLRLGEIRRCLTWEYMKVRDTESNVSTYYVVVSISDENLTNEQKIAKRVEPDNRTVGFELEVTGISSQYSLRGDVRNNSDLSDIFEVVGDSSIEALSNGNYGEEEVECECPDCGHTHYTTIENGDEDEGDTAEVRSLEGHPISVITNKELIKELISVIESCGDEDNREGGAYSGGKYSCGLHVHVQVTKKEREWVAQYAIEHEQEVWDLYPPHHSRQGYCKSYAECRPDDEPPTVKWVISQASRYVWLNICVAWSESRPTVECRLFDGTLDEDVLIERVKWFHTFVCQAIREGKERHAAFLQRQAELEGRTEPDATSEYGLVSIEEPKNMEFIPSMYPAIHVYQMKPIEVSETEEAFMITADTWFTRNNVEPYRSELSEWIKTSPREYSFYNENKERLVVEARNGIVCRNDDVFTLVVDHNHPPTHQVTELIRYKVDLIYGSDIDEQPTKWFIHDNSKTTVGNMLSHEYLASVGADNIHEGRYQYFYNFQSLENIDLMGINLNLCNDKHVYQEDGQWYTIFEYKKDEYIIPEPVRQDIIDSVFVENEVIEEVTGLNRIRIYKIEPTSNSFYYGVQEYNDYYVNMHIIDYLKKHREAGDDVVVYKQDRTMIYLLNNTPAFSTNTTAHVMCDINGQRYVITQQTTDELPILPIQKTEIDPIPSGRLIIPEIGKDYIIEYWRLRDGNNGFEMYSLREEFYISNMMSILITTNEYRSVECLVLHDTTLFFKDDVQQNLTPFRKILFTYRGDTCMLVEVPLIDGNRMSIIREPEFTTNITVFDVEIDTNDNRIITNRDKQSITVNELASLIRPKAIGNYVYTDRSPGYSYYKKDDNILYKIMRDSRTTEYQLRWKEYNRDTDDRSDEQLTKELYVQERSERVPLVEW